MRHLPELPPDLLLEICAEKHQVFPADFLTKFPDFVEPDACCCDFLVDFSPFITFSAHLAVLLSFVMPECSGQICRYGCQHPVVCRYARNFPVNADYDPFPVLSFHNQKSCNSQIYKNLPIFPIERKLQLSANKIFMQTACSPMAARSFCKVLIDRCLCAAVFFAIPVISVFWRDLKCMILKNHLTGCVIVIYKY